MSEPRRPDDLLPSEENPIPFGRYQLVELVGEGAMAQVYRARQSGPMGFSKEVALKRLRAGTLTRDRKEIEALINEARLGGQLRHPNIVEIYSCDVHDGAFFLAMEYVRGWLLDDVLWRVLGAGEQLPRGAILDAMRQIAQGLTYAHEATDERGAPLSLVHRDLKPQNIFVDRSGVLKIADFGLAKSTANLYRTTDADETKGSPLYMSPEQIGGSAIDSRSDLFAFGTIIIELATGLRAFEGTSIPNTLMRVLNVECEEAMGALAQQMPELLPITGRLLQQNPADRYQTAREVLRDLDMLAGDVASGVHTRGLVGALLGEDTVGVPESILQPYRELSQRLAAARALLPDPTADLRQAPGPAWAEPSGTESVVLPADSEGITGVIAQRRLKKRKRARMKQWATLASLVLVAGGLLGGIVWMTWTMRGDMDELLLQREGEPAPPREDVVDVPDVAPPPVETTPAPIQSGPAIHIPRASARVGQDLPVVVQMTDGGTWTVTCQWRPSGGEFRPLPLIDSGGGRFEASIPLVEEIGTSVEYYLQIEERGTGQRVMRGSAEAPLRVGVLR